MKKYTKKFDINLSKYLEIIEKENQNLKLKGLDNELKSLITALIAI